MRDVAYELIPHAQRRQLHGKLATLYNVELGLVPDAAGSHAPADFSSAGDGSHGGGSHHQSGQHQSGQYSQYGVRSLRAGMGDGRSSFRLRQSTNSTIIAHHATLACAGIEEEDPDMVRVHTTLVH